jgi:hypothetical protein
VPALRRHGWLHTEIPWLGDRAGECGGAGAPRPDCNAAPNQDDPPRPPEGFKIQSTRMAGGTEEISTDLQML